MEIQIPDAMERVMLRFVGGGPTDGDFEAKTDAWPPPEELAGGLMGRYILQSHSDLPDGHPNLIRGAVYRFVPREEN